MTTSNLGIVAAYCHAGSSRRIHATYDRPGDRTNMGVGHMGWYGKTLCGLLGDAWSGSPFMRPLNGSDGLTWDDYMAGDKPHNAPCPKCRAAYNKGEVAA